MLKLSDARESKLSGWASELIAGLRQQVESLTHEVAAIEVENNRLRTVIEGKYGGEIDADTFYVNDDTAQQVPLGNGVTIRFGNFYDVKYDAADGGVLAIEGDQSVQVYPVSDYEVTVDRRAGGG